MNPRNHAQCPGTPHFLWCIALGCQLAPRSSSAAELPPCSQPSRERSSKLQKASASGNIPTATRRCWVGEGRCGALGRNRDWIIGKNLHRPQIPLRLAPSCSFLDSSAASPGTEGGPRHSLSAILLATGGWRWTLRESRLIQPQPVQRQQTKPQGGSRAGPSPGHGAVTACGPRRPGLWGRCLHPASPAQSPGAPRQCPASPGTLPWTSPDTRRVDPSRRASDLLTGSRAPPSGRERRAEKLESFALLPNTMMMFEDRASTQQSPFKNSFWHVAKGFRKLFYRGPRCGRGHTRWDLQGLVPPLPAGWSGAPLRWPATREDSPQAGGNPGHQRRAHQAPRPLAHHLACSGSYSSDSATVSAAVKRGPAWQRAGPSPTRGWTRMASSPAAGKGTACTVTCRGGSWSGQSVVRTTLWSEQAPPQPGHQLSCYSGIFHPGCYVADRRVYLLPTTLKMG